MNALWIFPLSDPFGRVQFLKAESKRPWFEMKAIIISWIIIFIIKMKVRLSQDMALAQK